MREEINFFKESNIVKSKNDAKDFLASLGFTNEQNRDEVWQYPEFVFWCKNTKIWKESKNVFFRYHSGRGWRASRPEKMNLQEAIEWVYRNRKDINIALSSYYDDGCL